MTRRWAGLIAALAVMLCLVPPPLPSAAAAPRRQVTVDQKGGLVNQVVRVSWRGFKPSSSNTLLDTTYYVVRVYQCRGSRPASVAECYGSSTYRYPGKANNIVIPDGPSNAVTTVTQANGTGQAEVEVRTKRESSTLGCDSTRACSLVVVPNDGDPAQPDLDYSTGTQAQIDQPWAWAKRVVIPLNFSRAGETCRLKQADAAAAGSPGARRLMEQWQPALCQGSKPTDIDYSALGEPEARSAFGGKRLDLGLTTLPDTNTPTRPYTYAPIGISGIAIAYRIDDFETGRPITDLKLTPRLVAKLITQSYGMTGLCSEGVKDCNRAVSGNPLDLFADPEFQRINSAHEWSPMGWPTVVSGENDLAYELTRWLAADGETRAFMTGGRAPGGMHVNRHFKGVRYPVTNFSGRDPYPKFAHGYIPVLGLGEVARFLVTNRDNSENYEKDDHGNYPKTPPYSVGKRGLIAIVGTADAAALRFPVAKIRNAAGRYAGPTERAMRAATDGTRAGKDKITRLVDFGRRAPAAYPLTMIHYAQAPTGGLDKAKAEKIARFLDHASGTGQRRGLSPGLLPPGYVPLPDSMRAQTRQAAGEVRAQKGKLPGQGGDHPTTPKPTDQPKVPKAGPSPSITLPVVAGPAPMGGRLSSGVSPMVRWLLPTLLGGGLGAALLGSVLWGTGSAHSLRPTLRQPPRPPRLRPPGPPPGPSAEVLSDVPGISPPGRPPGSRSGRASRGRHLRRGRRRA